VSTPASAGTPVTSTSLSFTGTLRQHSANYILEEREETEPVGEFKWATPRIYRLLVTAATQLVADELTNCLVTVTGHPEYMDDRHQMFLTLERLEPIRPVATDR
jgi:hypothetical protein